MQASTTLMVPEKHLSRVAGLNQTLQGFTNIISPPLGALLVETLPTQTVLAIDVGTAMLAVMPLLFISIPQPLRKTSDEESKPSVLIDLREGLRFVWDWSGIRILIGIASFHSLVMSAAFSLIPILVADHFRAGAPELGWMQSATGLGTILGGLVIGVWGGFRRRIVTAMLSAVLQGIGVTVMGLAPATAFPLAVGAQFFALFVGSMGNSALIAVLQTTVPPEMQARVFTLVVSLATAMSPIGLAIAGPVADVWGVQSWFLIAGVFTIGIGAGAFFVPALMRIEQMPAENALIGNIQRR
jgi:DHA3 family macrolide efflux protein-like MFS transporter